MMQLKGRPVAELALAILFLSAGLGWAQLTPDQNSDPTQYTHYGKPPSTSDFKELLDKAGQGDADAQEQVGAAYCNGADNLHDYMQGRVWLQKAADQKNARALSWLGVLYANGFGVPQDQAKAFQYFLAAATEGNDKSDQVEVAERYARGNGTSVSDVESLSWYMKAAAQGSSQAQLEAGLDYFNGKGATKDPEKAFGYFLQASHHNVERAQYYLAYFYWNGVFVSRDPVQAYKWSRLATRHHPDDDATALAQEITPSLTPEQVEQGEALLDSWSREMRGDVSTGPPHATFTTGTSATMPFESIDGEIVITATINGHDKLKFMLDTGAPRSLIDSISVSQYNIPRSSSYESLSGVGKQTVLGSHTDDLSLALPGITFDHMGLDISSCTARIDGILGFDVLSNYVVEIDYAAKTVKFMAPESFHAADAGQLLPSKTLNTKIFVQAKINNNNFETDYADFILDTGCGDGFVISQHYLLSYPLLTFAKGREGEAEGIGGVLWAERVPCFAAEVGDIPLKEPLVTTVKRDQGVFMHFNGLIGNEVWKNFVLTIDYPKEQLFLKPNPHSDDATTPAPVTTENSRRETD